MPKPKSAEPPQEASPAAGAAGLSAGRKLSRLIAEARAKAGMTLAQVGQITKIHLQMLDALEKGRFDEIPSPTHVRAFSLAVMKAVQGDEQQILLAWKELTTPEEEAAPVPAPAAIPAPAAVPVPAAKPKPAAPAKEAPLASVAPSVMQSGHPQRTAQFWYLWAAMAAGVILVLWGLSLIGHKPAASAKGLASLSASDAGAAVTGTAGPERILSPREKLRAASLAAALAAPLSTTAVLPGGALGPGNLALRARLACWLVLKVDGQLLPAVTMVKGEKRFWKVEDKAVLLAGNLGALRIWWQGENLGYLGPKGERANGLVFETGKKWRRDSAQALPLPEPLPGDPGGSGTGSEGPEATPDASDTDGMGAAN